MAKDARGWLTASIVLQRDVVRQMPKWVNERVGVVAHDSDHIKQVATVQRLAASP